MGNAGAKIKGGFETLGKKLGEGWSSAKSIGNKVWNSVKSVPVLGKIAEGVEKYTPIGFGATQLARQLDTGISSASKLLQGDVKGAVGTVTSGIRQDLNYKNPVAEKLKALPVIGKVAEKAEDVLTRIPVAGGLSVRDIRNIGNASLNAVDALKEGNVKEALGQGAKAGLEYASTRGGAFGNAANAAKRFV
jgi:hypothetical protein